MTGLPEALAGQAIEDLAYGAGTTEFELERGGAFGTGWWSSSDDEEEEEDGVGHIPFVDGYAKTNFSRSISIIYPGPRTNANRCLPHTIMIQTSSCRTLTISLLHPRTMLSTSLAFHYIRRHLWTLWVPRIDL